MGSLFESNLSKKRKINRNEKEKWEDKIKWNRKKEREENIF